MADLSGTTSASGLAEIANYLQTDKGTAGASLRLALEARKSFGKLLDMVKSENDRVTLVVNLMREGPQYWDRVKSDRGLSDKELVQWKADPVGFRKSDDSSPSPLKIPETSARRQRQISKIVESTKESEEPKPFGH
jgi:hypothetical protein